jgi:hypothetical protein
VVTCRNLAVRECFSFLEFYGRVADGQKSAPKGGSRLIGRAQDVGRARREKRRNEKGAKSLKTNDRAKTAKRKRDEVIENKQSREMTDSAPIMIPMTYGMPCETFRFAWRNEGFVFTRFSASSRPEAKWPGRSDRAGSSREKVA